MTHLYPRALQIWARPMPVLPAVPSTTVPPGFSWPVCVCVCVYACVCVCVYVCVCVCVCVCGRGGGQLMQHGIQNAFVHRGSTCTSNSGIDWLY